MNPSHRIQEVVYTAGRLGTKIRTPQCECTKNDLWSAIKAFVLVFLCEQRVCRRDFVWRCMAPEGRNGCSPSGRTPKKQAQCPVGEERWCWRTLPSLAKNQSNCDVRTLRSLTPVASSCVCKSGVQNVNIGELIF